MADVTQKQKKRNPWDEVDQETGEVYQDVPGVQHDPISGAVMELPAAMVAGPASAGEGFIARMISKGAPRIAAGAEKAAAQTAATAAGKAATTTALDSAGAQIATRAAGPSTSQINSALRNASPRVQDMVLNKPGLMDRIRTEGLKVINELENGIKSGVKSVARGSIGAKSQDQLPSTQSAPNSSAILNYKNMK